MDSQALVTVDEVARRLNVHPETVRVWIRQGHLAGFRLGGRRAGYRISERALQEFLSRRDAQQSERGGHGLLG